MSKNISNLSLASGGVLDLKEMLLSFRHCYTQRLLLLGSLSEALCRVVAEADFRLQLGISL